MDSDESHEPITASAVHLSVVSPQTEFAIIILLSHTSSQTPAYIPSCQTLTASKAPVRTLLPTT